MMVLRMTSFEACTRKSSHFVMKALIGGRLPLQQMRVQRQLIFSLGVDFRCSFFEDSDCSLFLQGQRQRLCQQGQQLVTFFAQPDQHQLSCGPGRSPGYHEAQSGVLKMAESLSHRSLRTWLSRVLKISTVVVLVRSVFTRMASQTCLILQLW